MVAWGSSRGFAASSPGQRQAFVKSSAGAAATVWKPDSLPVAEILAWIGLSPISGC